MEIKGYVILQAVGKKNIGIKGDGNCDWYYRVYPKKEDAMDFLRMVIMNVKKEQGQGLRPKNNLNADESLDFYIQEVKVKIPTKETKSRGWKWR